MFPKLEVDKDNSWHWLESSWQLWVGSKHTYFTLGHHLMIWGLPLCISVWPMGDQYHFGFSVLCFHFSFMWRGL